MNTFPKDVVEALVREYLVRADCNAALEAFNREKPKHNNSITKREILRKALGLDKAAAFFKKQNPSESIPSTLEVWVNYQMAKLNSVPDAPAAPPQAPRPLRPMPRDAEEPAEASVPVVPTRRPGSSSGLGSLPAAAPPGGAGRPVPVRQGFGFGDSPAPRPAAPPAPAARRGSVPSYDEDSEPEIIRPAARPSGPSAGVRSSHSGGMPHSASASTVGLRTSAPGGPPLASSGMTRTGSGATVGSAGSGGFTPPRAPVAQRPAATAAPRAPASRGGFGQRHGGELVMEDVGDVSFGDDDGPGLPAAGFGTMKISGPATRKPGASISPDVMRQLRQLLWGPQGQPPPSWKQGLFFNRRTGLQFGLLQKQGGPCGVLAGVQAHVLAALHSPSTGFNTAPRAPDQQSALTAAITESLWQARMGPTAAIILPEGEAGGAAGRLGYDQLSRALTQHTAASKDALMDLVRGALSVFMTEDGWGVVLFVMSLALSRGVTNVQGDMDEPGNSLMGMHGYCTQELVHLILLGAATSNVFDGNKQLDGTTTLKGISRRCRLGMLTLFEWYKYVEVGASLKNPALPVWVVCSESHFTVLFAQDAKALQNQLPFDLYYYDELSNQESIIKLSVAKDPKGGWSARMGSTIGDRGKCEGHNIPPLECVIETRWPGVKVNWNGHDPIL